MPSLPEEIQVPLADGAFTLRGRRWSDPAVTSYPTSKRVLAWPGWLDNCGSFDAIAPYFVQAGYTLVVLDPPGCGLSDHLPQFAWYKDYEECAMIVEAADVLGWTEPFVLAAHSRGGNIAAYTCGAFTDRFVACVLFDCSFGTSGVYISKLEKPTRLADTVAQDDRNKKRQPRLFDTVEEAIDHNFNNILFKKTKITSENIVRRHIVQREEDGKWTFTHDYRTYGQLQPLSIDETSGLEFLKSIKCPVLHLVSQYGLLANLEDHQYEHFAKHARRFVSNEETVHRFREIVRTRVASIPSLTMVPLKGFHHMHSDKPAMCSAEIFPWLDNIVDVFSQTDEVMYNPPADLRAESPMMKAGMEVMRQAFISKPQFFDPVALAPPAPPVRVQDITLDVGGLTLACRLWGDQHTAKARVIAWPGWLDNTGSFDSIAPLYCQEGDTCFLAVDPPGCGLSDWLPVLQRYSLEDEAVLVLDVAKALGWQTFHLVGHSRGGGVCVTAACAGGDVVESLTVLDSPISMYHPEEWCPSEMYLAYKQELKNRGRKTKERDSFDSMVLQSFNNVFFPKAMHTAYAITKRHAKKLSSKKWTFTHDPKTYGDREAFRTSRSILRTGITQLKCPTRFIYGDSGVLNSPIKLDLITCVDTKRAVIETRNQRRTRCVSDMGLLLGSNANVDSCVVEGFHHVHSDDPSGVAAVALPFIRHFAGLQDGYEKSAVTLDQAFPQIPMDAKI